MKDLNPTTRRFPRSLVDAYPTHYPEWFEPPPKKQSDGIVFYSGVCLWVLVIYLIA